MTGPVHPIPRSDISPTALEYAKDIVDFDEPNDFSALETKATAPNVILGDAGGKTQTPDAPAGGGDARRAHGLRPDAPAFHLGELGPVRPAPPNLTSMAQQLAVHVGGAHDGSSTVTHDLSLPRLGGLNWHARPSPIGTGTSQPQLNFSIRSSPGFRP
jgi:hypothetical protein